MGCLHGALVLFYTFRRGNEASRLKAGAWGTRPFERTCAFKGEAKQAHPVCSRLCWSYGRGVSGVAEELPSFTAQNGKSFGRKVWLYFII